MKHTPSQDEERVQQDSDTDPVIAVLLQEDPQTTRHTAEGYRERKEEPKPNWKERREGGERKREVSKSFCWMNEDVVLDGKWRSWDL